MVDDRLRLIFTCCHPALAIEARVALTLRTVCGVPTADIARALLVSESTMTRRLTRAKEQHRATPDPVPGARAAPALTERLPGVLAVLYLLFTRGYVADGEPAFADEAIRLARLLDAAHAGASPRSPRCWPCACSSTPAATPAATRQATCSPWTGRTARGGTAPRSPRALALAGSGTATMARTRWQARIAACHATAPSAARHRLAGDRRGLRRARPASDPPRSSRSTARSRTATRTAPTAGLALLDAAHAGGALDGYPLAVAVRGRSGRPAG